MDGWPEKEKGENSPNNWNVDIFVQVVKEMASSTIFFILLFMRLIQSVFIQQQLTLIVIIVIDTNLNGWHSHLLCPH